MSFSKNLNKLLLIGSVLVGGSMNGNCCGTYKTLSGNLQIDSSSLSYRIQLEQSPKLSAILKVFFCLDAKNSLETSYNIQDENWLRNEVCRNLFLSKFAEEIHRLKGGIPGIIYLKELSHQMETKLVELDSVAEFNKDLDLVPIMVDDIGRSGKDSSLLKCNVNKILSQFVEMHSKDQDYADINFLIGLLKMLHRFPNELPTVVTEKIPDILKSLDCPEITGSKTAKEAIYDYIVDISEESLGEFHI